MSVINDYTRSVSFDNVTNESFAEVYPTVDFNDINFGYGSSKINEVPEFYNNSSFNNYTYNKNKRKSSCQTHSAPKKSILKNKLSQQQLEYNMTHCNKTINYHDDLDDIIRNYNQSQEHDKSMSMYGEKLKNTSNGAAATKSRRKSYSEMTDEELMELDPQFKNTRSKVDLMDQFKFDSQKTYYREDRKSVSIPKLELNGNKPKPNLNYKSINLNYRHEHFMLHRTLLLLIDGRKHTWNSLYYLINSDFLENGDHIIIASLLPGSVSDSAMILNKCQNLITWFLQQIRPNLILRVTVEYVLNEDTGNTTGRNSMSGNGSSSHPSTDLNYKKFINNLYNQYNPNLVLFGNKSTNLNFKYPIKLKKNNYNKFLIRFSSYLIKYSTIPVLLVNANMAPAGRDMRKPSIQSIQSESSISSASSNDKINDNKDNSTTGSDMANEISNDLKNVNYLTFENLIKKISDKSLSESKQYLELLNQQAADSNVSSQDNLGSVKFNKVSFKDSKISKVNSTYTAGLSRLNSDSSEVYKVKSLLDNSDGLSVNKSVKSESSGTSSGLTNKQIKKNLKKEPRKQPQKKKGFWKRIFS